MARWGSCDFRQLKEFQQKIEKLAKADYQAFMRAVSKELAARLLRGVIPNTPVGVYPPETGKVGGTLRRGWTGGKDINPTVYAYSLPIEQSGNTYTITVINPTEYAAYVEYGHRQTPGRFVPAIGKRLKKGWVDGRFMLTTAEMKLEQQLPKIIEKKLTKLLQETMQ